MGKLANGVGAATLSYDGVGQRVQKAISGSGGSTITNYFYDAFGQLAAESVNGVWSRDYIRDGGGNLIATENAAGGVCTTCYFAYDHLGSVRLVMDQSGTVVGRHDYLPFGEDVSGNAGADFMSSQSWNGYGYVLGNPLNAVDPSGTRWVTFQVQVCTPSISSTIVYYTLPSGSSNGTTSACHSVPMEIWVDDNPPVISIGGGSGPGGAGPGGGSGSGGSGGGTSQPVKNTPTRAHCLGQALKADGNGVSLGLDLLGVGAGFLPGGGLVAGSARAVRTAFAVQTGLTAASFANSVAYKSGPGIVAGIVGGQMSVVSATTAEELGGVALNLGRSVPLLGVAINVGTTLYDGYQTYRAYSACLNGAHE